jgi:imidazole glycerol-phosphate synthase subunit HisF
VYAHTQKKNISVDLFEYIHQLIEAGAGEIIINSVDLDGTMLGLDKPLIHKIANQINVPLIACGGVGTLTHIKEGVDMGASAVAAGSFFVYHGKHKAVLINYPERIQLKNLFA